MKQRILTGWNFRRAAYLIVGLFILVQAIMEKQWLGLVAGGYFASMGLLGFGCAAGNCFSGYNRTTIENQETTFEELKNEA